MKKEELSEGHKDMITAIIEAIANERNSRELAYGLIEVLKLYYPDVLAERHKQSRLYA